MMRILKFNMIEIVLAIGIAAFGVTAVVAMIPPALNANRDVSADAFVDEAVSKIGAYVNLVLLYQNDWSAKCPNSRTAMSAVSKPSGDPVIPGFNMWQTSSNGVYWMESSDGTPFVATLWCGPVINDFYNGSSTGQTLNQGVRIYAELSWPANRPANRETRLFCWDVFKQ